MNNPYKRNHPATTAQHDAFKAGYNAGPYLPDNVEYPHGAIVDDAFFQGVHEGRLDNEIEATAKLLDDEAPDV